MCWRLIWIKKAINLNSLSGKKWKRNQRLNSLELISKVGFYVSHKKHKEHKVVIVNTFFFVHLAALPAAGRFVGKITFERASNITGSGPSFF
jgi:hypothetical protein